MPRRLGGHRVVRLLGQGGMGSVYLAEGPAGEHVAVKVIRDERLGDEEYQRRFTREVEILRKVAESAPDCTVRIIGSGFEGDRAYLATEYVDGPDLHARVRESGPLTEAELVDLGTGIASALQAMHDAHVVHRDLKPGNVLLAPTGPKVIDFGIAQMGDGLTTATQIAPGTAGYMSPEQAMGQPSTPASDVFAWGAVMAYAATGRCPFGEDAVAVVTHRLVYEEPDLEGIDGRLRDLIKWALHKEPDRRPSVERLFAAMQGQEVLVPAESWTIPDPYGRGGEIRRRFPYRGAQRVAGLAATAAGVAGVLIGTGALKTVSAAVTACGLVLAVVPYPWRSRRLGLLVVVTALLVPLNAVAGTVPIGRQACVDIIRSTSQDLELTGFDTKGAAVTRTPGSRRWTIEDSKVTKNPDYTWAGIRASLPDWCRFRVDLDVTLRGPGPPPTAGMGWGYGLGVCSRFDGSQPRGLSLQYSYYQGKKGSRLTELAVTRLPSANAFVDDQPDSSTLELDGNAHHWQISYDHGRVLYTLDHATVQTAWYPVTGYPLPDDCLGTEFLLRVWLAEVEVDNVMVSAG
ncbi:serine/threonine-protein kinase [Nonomuraea fuscirosea]|uniref:serine/threonine-protein kinase n=1 Tax=Nonomuraea fuscirosea TaxID=1291556 RepID=UPI003445FD84